MKRVGLLLFLVAIATYVHVSVATAQMKLNLEQAHILRELLKDSKIDSVTLPKEIAVGDPLPGGIQPSAMPPEIAAKLPQIKSHFLVLGAQQIIIVDSNREKVAEIIDR